MNTQAISNVFSVLPNQASTAKPDSNATEAGSFGQVLSREMKDQGAPTSTNAARKDNQGSTGDKAKSDSTDTPQASGKDTTAVSDEDKTTATTSEPKVDESEVDPAAAAELAAFMAALTQANPAPAAANNAAGAADIAVDIGKQLATDTTDDTALELKTESTTPGATNTTTKEAAGKPEDFVAALDKAGKNMEAGAKAAVSPVKADIEKAIVQTAKAIDMPAAPTPQNISAASAAATLQQLNDLQNQQASNRLTPHVGTQGWDQALGQKVVWMVQGLQQTATLTLNPPDLGPMQVTVNVHNNQATANFTAPQPEVRHALEAAMPRLREMLNDAGIQLSESSVSAGSSNQQSNAFADSQQNGRGSRASSQVEAAPIVSQATVTTSGTGMVDTFA
ncbi:MAG: flagellar hook-length control protein FliK [Oxalicibacterium faecigallinarum]|uniref:flagellar hook-length control protein FliK n=1 Tax=Oxalicibacterium faecigallinarum TaxID=573741 RepID=UPI002807D196|nr:flagellar hook-length control protein FliK [Oxalicibacterium faecigallinarum]MDQ7969938.1 flagellar hook-length control protein FliK [Oxalicibacterium faecigallinarum]